MGPILIAGSSIMEHWTDMVHLVPGLTMKNIAVGGTTTMEWTRWLDSRILPLKPEGLVFYCGSNDFNRGEPWARIAERTLDILSRFSVACPRVRVAYLHVIRAPQKETVWADILQLKEHLESAFPSMPMVHGIDPNPIFFEGETSRREYFIADALHLTPEAYRIWGLDLGPKLAHLFQDPTRST